MPCARWSGTAKYDATNHVKPLTRQDRFNWTHTPHHKTTFSTYSKGLPRYVLSSSRGPVLARSASWRAFTAACIHEDPYWGFPDPVVHVSYHFGGQIMFQTWRCCRANIEYNIGRHIVFIKLWHWWVIPVTVESQQRNIPQLRDGVSPFHNIQNPIWPRHMPVWC